MAELDTLVGKIISRDDEKVIVQWFGSYDKEALPLAGAPEQLATAQPEFTITATFFMGEDGPRQWHDCIIGEPLLPLTEEDLNGIDDIDSAPIGYWPKVKRTT